MGLIRLLPRPGGGQPAAESVDDAPPEIAPVEEALVDVPAVSEPAPEAARDPEPTDVVPIASPAIPSDEAASTPQGVGTRVIVLANQKGGVRNWEPLLYLTYARLPLASLRDNAVAIAQLLLDRGANPNAYYMAGHSVYGALVGIAGDGEQDAPPHPARDELYRLLLARGAEPYDIQVLYNTHFRGDVMWWLTLTWDYSVAAGRTGDWSDPDLPIFDMGGYGTGARFLLWLAIRKNSPALAEWLLARGGWERTLS